MGKVYSKDKKKSSTLENQLKYRIIPKRGENAVAQLEKAGTIGAYKFQPGSTLEIYDTYFDTANSILSKTGALLRSRLVNEKNLTLALLTSDSVGSDSRYAPAKVEGEPNSTTLAAISNCLLNMGIAQQRFSDAEFSRVGFEGLFRAWGLKEICTREKRWSYKYVVDRHGRRIAKLCIGKLLLYNAQRTSKDIEIQIEAEKDIKYTLRELDALLRQKLQASIGPPLQSEYQDILSFIQFLPDLRLETKLSINSDELEGIMQELQRKAHIGDFSLGPRNTLKIKDIYFDTTEFRLKEKGCYLRLRKLGGEELLTLRQYTNRDDNQILNTIEIKDLATRDTLLRILRRLTEKKILKVSESTILELPVGLYDCMAKLGLRPALHTKINRRVFPVIDRGEYFANIKLDDVTFGVDGLTKQYGEVEVAAQNAGYLIQTKALAYSLMSKFRKLGMELMRQPKYIVGLDLIHTGKIPQGTAKKSVHFYTRAEGEEEINILDVEVPEINGEDKINGKTPCVFIGHGRNALWARLQLFLEKDLHLRTVSYESESRIGKPIIPILEEMLNKANFAVLILTAEDETAVGGRRARQNVIHEAGLFQGKLGFEKVFLLIQEGLEEFTNVSGLQHIPFSGDKLEQTFHEIRRALDREGIINSNPVA